MLVSQVAWQVLFGKHSYWNTVAMHGQNAALRRKLETQLTILGIERLDVLYDP